MKIKAFIVLLLLVQCISCDDNEKNNINNNNNSTYNNSNDTNTNIAENIDTIYNYVVMDRISKMDSNLTTYVIKKYNSNTKNVSLDLINNYTAGFQYKEDNYFFQTKVQLIYPNTNKEIVCLSSYKADNEGYINYFYFLQNYNGMWSNISQLIMSEDVIDFLETELKTIIDYKTINHLSAFYTEKCPYALLFEFSTPSQIFVFKDDKWQSIAEIDLSEYKLSIVQKETNTAGTKMLSSNELDKALRFTSLNSAFEDSTEVYILDLSSSGLYVLDKKISLLKRLQIIILNENYIEEIPNEISSLKNLQILRCCNNNLKSLPENIGDLKNIEEISCSYNKLTYIPLSLSRAKSLKILNIDHNELSTFIIDFSMMQNLVILNISDNNIKQLPTSIGKLENLISLNISNNPIESFPSQFFELKNLTYLDIRNTKIPDEQIVQLMKNNPDLTIVMD